MDDTKRQIRVLALGSAASLLGWAEKPMPIAAGATLGDVVGELERAAPDLRALRSRVRYALNQQYAPPTAAVSPGDEVAIIPPVSGG